MYSLKLTRYFPRNGFNTDMSVDTIKSLIVDSRQALDTDFTCDDLQAPQRVADIRLYLGQPDYQVGYDRAAVFADVIQRAAYWQGIKGTFTLDPHVSID